MKKTLTLLLLLAFAVSARAQLFVDTTYTINQMIEGFFDNSGIEISNVTYTGSQQTLAFFEGSQSNIGLNAGLLLTTGSAATAVGPNNDESAGVSLGIPGSIWLDALTTPFQTHDAVVIEMDIVPDNDTISFQYVFGSEEYKEYVNSSFNDVFAFFITGPGFPETDSIYVEPDTVITTQNLCYYCGDTLLSANQEFCYTPFPIESGIFLWECVSFPIDTLFAYCTYDTAQCPADTVIYPGYWYISPGGANIAAIPGTNLPVTINNLNQFVNTQFFVDNEGGQTVQYDAFTTPLWATTAVTAGETYHVRIAIADTGDQVFDSGVFLSIQSLGGDSLLGVDPAFIAMPTGHTVDFDNETLWATEWHWDFGDGATSNERFPTHTYTADGVYNVKLTASNWCSQETTERAVQIGTSGVQEPATDMFSISPNPATGAFVLDLKRRESVRMQVVSIDGRLLFDQNVADGQRIDLSRFEKGVLIARVQADDQVWTERIIHQ